MLSMKAMRTQRSSPVYVEIVVLVVGLLALSISLVSMVLYAHIYREFWVIFWSLGSFGWISSELCLIALPSFRTLRSRLVLQVLIFVIGSLVFGSWLSIWLSNPSYKQAALAVSVLAGCDLGSIGPL